MKAALRDRYGGPEVIEVREVDRPVPTEDRVLVRIHAASVNRADLDGLYPRWQFSRLFYGLTKPRIRRLGLDVAGVVEEVGPAATRFAVGDRVYGDLFSFGWGAFAEYVCTRERAFGRIPDAMSFEVAATLPHSAILALEALNAAGRPELGPGQRVLIDGGSGNVGPFAIQIAKARGAEVTATARTERLDFVREAGADHAIDYTKVDYTRTGQRYDWIVDTDSHHSIFDARRALKPGGLYRTLGGSTASLLGLLFVAPIASRTSKARMGMLLGWRPFNNAPAEVAELEALVAAGRVRPFIDRRFSLDQVADAVRYVDERRSTGKVVITV